MWALLLVPLLFLCLWAQAGGGRNDTLLVIAVHHGHDPAIVVAQGGLPLIVLDLQQLAPRAGLPKLFIDGFPKVWPYAYRTLLRFLGSLRPPLAPPFDVAVATDWRWPTSPIDPTKDLPALVPHRQFQWRHHHEAHGLHGFWDSPFRTALVITTDGGGDDGTFHVWRGDKSARAFESLKAVPVNLGKAFGNLASAVGLSKAELTAHAMLGSPRPHWVRVLRPAFRASKYQWRAIAAAETAVRRWRVGADTRADYAASVQAALEELLFAAVQGFEPAAAEVEGVVLSGGVALNWKLPLALQRHFGRPVHVPFAPADNGVALGLAHGVQPPPLRVPGAVFRGLPLTDLPELGAYVASCRAVAADAGRLLDLLLGNAVVGVVRGRHEVGFRALGHRSLLAVPAAGPHAALAKMAHKRWPEPLPCATLPDAAAALFQDNVTSPYMSCGTRYRPGVTRQYPALGEAGGLSLPQIVQPEDEWLTALLRGLQARGAPPLLLNLPMQQGSQRCFVLSIRDALQFLKSQRDVDYVVVEGFLFGRARLKGCVRGRLECQPLFQS